MLQNTSSQFSVYIVMRPTLALLIFVFLFSCVHSLHFGGFRSAVLRTVRLRAVTEARTALVVPKGPITQEKIVKTIQKWSHEQEHTGSIILAQDDDRGVKFVLQSEDRPFLSITAEDTGASIELRLLQSLPGTDHQYHSLVKLLSNTLMDSICSEVGMLALRTQRSDRPLSYTVKSATAERSEAVVAPTVESTASDVSGSDDKRPAEPDSVSDTARNPELSDKQDAGKASSTGNSLLEDAVFPFKKQTKAAVFEIPVDSAEEVEEAVQQVKRAADAVTEAQRRTTRPKQEQQQQPQRGGNRHRDPEIAEKAARVGVRLDAFEGRGLEEQAVKELNALLRNSRGGGFLNVMRDYAVNSTQLATFASAEGSSGIPACKPNATAGSAEPLVDLFEQGRRISEQSVAEMLSRPMIGETAEQLRQPTPTLPLHLSGQRGAAVARGEVVDLFQSPSELYADPAVVKAVSPAGAALRESDQTPGGVGDVSSMTAADPVSLPLDRQRLGMLLTELTRTAAERHDSILDGYRDLLLSDNMLYLLRDANATVADTAERRLFHKITEKTIALTTEVAALVKTESVRHLETIHAVCEIAAQFQHDEEEFLSRLQYLKPRFDTDLLGYLAYAIAEEQASLRALGQDPALAPSQWLQVLTIVRQGVHAEFERRFDHLLEMLRLVVRFDDPEVRAELFRRFVSITPAMELPYLKALALNMVDGVLQHEQRAVGGATAEGLALQSAAQKSAGTATTVPASAAASTPAVDPSLLPRMHALKADVEAFLSDAYIREKMAAFEHEAKAQGKQIEIRHRNPALHAEREALRELEREQMLRGGLSIKLPEGTAAGIDRE